jgi:hypothetical protein
MKGLALGDGKVFHVDVVRCLEHWSAIDRGFRDAATGVVPVERRIEHGEAAMQFVKELFMGGGYTEAELQGFNATTALATLAELAKVGQELKRFFAVASDAPPASAARTELRFSTPETSN